MEKVNYSQETKDTGNALFRWLALVVCACAAKVLNKEELMNIYSAVGSSCGHSQEVDMFHSQTIEMMNYGKKNEKNN